MRVAACGCGCLWFSVHAGLGVPVCVCEKTDSAPITKEVTGAERQERLKHLQQLL